MWQHTGQQRPAFAVVPGPGQESVWDYPRPPRVARDAREVLVACDGVTVARSHAALRVLETASPPTFYLPRADIAPGLLEDDAGASWCEWKGQARYLALRLPQRRLSRVAWCYPDPSPPFEALRDHVGFYATPPLDCSVGGAPVTPQPGRFYAGWITPEVLGPFKGGPGSEGW